MLAPAGAIAAGGLYTATEFDVRGFDPLRPSLVEMGRAVVRDGHRNGGVVLLMWAGILAYLVAWILIPNEGQQSSVAENTVGKKQDSYSG